MYGLLVSRLQITPRLDFFTSQTVATARPTRIKNSPRAAGFLCRCSSAILCLSSSRLQSMTGIPLALANPPNPATNPPGRPHQMGIVQILLGAVVQSPPPASETTRRVAQPKVPIQDDAVHAIAAAVEKIVVVT